LLVHLCKALQGPSSTEHWALQAVGTEDQVFSTKAGFFDG
jgi:hypothetical protein